MFQNRFGSPWAAITWSTSVAGSIRPSLTHSRHNGSRFSCRCLSPFSPLHLALFRHFCSLARHGANRCSPPLFALHELHLPLLVKFGHPGREHGLNGLVGISPMRLRTSHLLRMSWQALRPC